MTMMMDKQSILNITITYSEMYSITHATTRINATCRHLVLVRIDKILKNIIVNVNLDDFNILNLVLITKLASNRICFGNIPILTNINMIEHNYYLKNVLLNISVKTNVINNYNLITKRESSSLTSQIHSIKNDYINKRLKDPSHVFDFQESNNIRWAYHTGGQEFNNSHPLINYFPSSYYHDKGISDELSISLWNDMMPHRFRASNLIELKEQAVNLIDHYDMIKPQGKLFTESEAIQYITAHSSSSFLGIQLPSKSSYALEAMNKTLKAHCDMNIKKRDWLIPNLNFVHDHLVLHPEIMQRYSGDVILQAKTSSASIPGFDSYRDFVFQNSYNDIQNVIFKQKHLVPYLMYAGIRNDRRGKYRLIFAMSAYFRFIDFLMTNGSYELCSSDILSQYTTEGYNNKQMWPELIRMANRNNVVAVCIDYAGYDTQFSMFDYLRISDLLNKHRYQNPEFTNVYDWYRNWILQPKPLVTRATDSGDDTYKILIEYHRTLASGLHGTHSFENLFGISTFKQLVHLGFNVSHIWVNGDDQNLLVSNSDVHDVIDWLSENFNISFEKSLIGHDLSVWGKMWFSNTVHPMWEIGTFRSIWEREKGEVNIVEPSKFESNYCKILQVAITLIRLGKNPTFVQYWIDLLCNQVNPVIDPHRIPTKLQNLTSESSISDVSLPFPQGLHSSKMYLKDKTYNLNVLGVTDFYDLMHNMYYNRMFYSLEVDDILYYPNHTQFKIDSGIDYSIEESDNIPWIYKNLNRVTSLTDQQMFVRNVLQGTKSYDGPSSNNYRYHNMLSLAYAINQRNKDVWHSSAIR